MKNREFLEEVLHSDICPEHFAKIYKEFEYYQRLAVETLREFHRICEKNAITYQLADGSLLGAIRDGGQIPWDYDVDVFVPYEEKDKLIEALKQELSDKYYFYCPEVNKKCRHFMMRVTPKGYRSEYLHVDVFYITGTPDTDAERKKYTKEIAKLSEIRFAKFVRISDAAYGHPKYAVKLLIKKLCCIKYINSDTTKLYRQLCSKYEAKKTEYCCNASVYAQEMLYPSKMWESELRHTDCGEFRVPKCYDTILTACYGNYTKLPPLENRIKEVLVHYQSLSKRGKN